MALAATSQVVGRSALIAPCLGSAIPGGMGRRAELRFGMGKRRRPRSAPMRQREESCLGKP